MSAVSDVRYHCRGIKSTYLFKVQEDTITLKIYDLAQKCIFKKTFSTLDPSFSSMPQLLDRGNFHPVIARLVNKALFPNELFIPIRKKVPNINEEALDQVIKHFKHQVFVEGEEAKTFTCPLTLELFQEPVMDDHGHTFEKSAIEEALKSTNECPVNRQPISSLTPNLLVKQTIEEWQQKDPIPSLAQCQKENPKLASTNLEMAHTCVKEKQYADALDFFDTAFKYTKKYEDYASLPLLYESMEEYEKATLAYLYLIKYQLLAGKKSEASETLKKCLEGENFSLQNHLALLELYEDAEWDCEKVPEDPIEAAKHFNLAADQGSAQAQFNLGICYGNGFGVTKDIARAFSYYKLAADQGFPEAQNRVGLGYSYGRGVTINAVEAAKYYTLAARQGHARAQCYLGVCYEKGDGVPQDHEEAFKYYKLGADQGLPEAQFNLGVCYEKGIGVPKELKTAAKYFKLAADQGDAEAQYRLGLSYTYDDGIPKDPFEAAKYFKLAADQGLPEAQFNLGICYDNGTGIHKDPAEAAKYYKLAADQELSEAQFNVGLCYASGSGVTNDPVEATKYFKLAADQGFAQAQFNLGVCYEDGCGVARDSIEATKYYKLAADQGFARAQFNLGVCYANGSGVPKEDPTEAIKYFKLAAEQGHAEAQSRLDACYANGSGSPKNLEETERGSKRAADQGQEQAKRPRHP